MKLVKNATTHKKERKKGRKEERKKERKNRRMDLSSQTHTMYKEFT